MNCSNCGNTLTPNARFCPSCGIQIAQQTQPVAGITTYSSYLPYNRVARHIQTLGYLWLAFAIWRTLSKLLAISLLHSIFGSHSRISIDQDWTSMGHFGLASLWPVIAMSLAIGLAISLLTAYALLTRQPWGRVMGIIAGVLALIHPILGTALGIYTLWVLAPALSGIEYDSIAATTQRTV